MLFHGNIESPNSYGTNELIKQGAIPVTSIDDFYDLWNNKSKQEIKESFLAWKTQKQSRKM